MSVPRLARSPSVWSAGLLALVALASPLLANGKPLLVHEAGRGWFSPALGGGRETAGGGSRGFVLRAPIPYSPTERVLRDRLQPPSRRHWLGTDHLGRDVASRLIHGARVSLGIGALATTLALLLGILIGGVAGYGGGWIDLVLSRLIEVFASFPALVLALTFIAYFPPGLLSLGAIIGIVGWTDIARQVRGEALRVRHQGFIDAARASGAGRTRILLRQVLPQALYVVVVPAAFLLARAILAEAALSMLGVGVAEPTPTWGNVLALSRTYLRQGWWLALFPGLCLFATLATCNRLGEALSRRGALTVEG